MKLSENLKMLNSLWQQRGPKVVKIPNEFPMPKDPWEWGLNICAQEPSLVGTIMRSAVEGVDDGAEGMMYAARGNAPQKVRDQLLEVARDSGEVQLQVEPIVAKHPPLAQFVETVFSPTLRQLYPFGHTLGNGLFVTGGPHTYNAHNDPGDNFLFQLAGRKLVRVWGPQAEFQREIIFDYNFRDHPEMFAGPVHEVELNAGEVLYFHDGMMHEVTVPEGERTVSIAMRADVHYSVLTLARELSSMVGEPSAYELLPEVNFWDKFRTKMFNPNRFAKSLETENGQKVMPEPLKAQLTRLLCSHSSSYQKSLDSNLDRWWAELCIRRNHCPSGILPTPPLDRAAQLKAWEDERLKKSS